MIKCAHFYYVLILHGLHVAFLYSSNCEAMAQQTHKSVRKAACNTRKAWETLNPYNPYNPRYSAV